MGRAPCCDKANVKRGSWSPDEDNTLRNYLEKHGVNNWIALPRKAGLRRCGKSCRLRWLNYLRPNIKLGGFTEEEDNIICSLYSSIGSRWSVIAAQLPGRTDNDVKNYWNTKLKKKVLAGKVVVGLNQNIDNQITNTTTDNNLSSGEFSASFPTDQVLESRAQGDFSHHLMTAKGSTSVSTCMKEMKYEETYDYPLGTTIMDQIDQFPLPGLMEVPDYSPSTANNMSSSQEVSSLSNSSSFPMEINNYAMYSNGDGVFLDQLDFESSHYPLNGSSFQANTSEVAASFGNFSFTASMTNI